MKQEFAIMKTKLTVLEKTISMLTMIVIILGAVNMFK